MDSSGSKVSHLANKNQYCIKNKIEGEVVVSHEIVKYNTPKMSEIGEDDESISFSEVNVEITDKIANKYSLKIPGFEKVF